jgi:DNA-binding response OmpR family regulator
VLSRNDSANAAELVLEKRPDLVLLDLKLGASNGFDVLKQLRTEDSMMPVILCTGYPLSPKEALDMGADDLVIKSSDLSELKLKIKKALKENPREAPYTRSIEKTSSGGDCTVYS